jgi:hypothetical protein
LDAIFKAICTRQSKARRREPASLLSGRGMPCKKSNAISFRMFFAAAVVPRARRQRVSDRVNLFLTEHDAVKGNAVMVTLGEMKNSEKFRFVAEGGEPPA